MTEVSTFQKQGLHKLVLSQPKSSLLWGNAPKSFFDEFRSTILVGNGKVSDAGKKRMMEAVKAKGVLIVRCNKYYKHGDLPNVVPHVPAVCSEVPKNVFEHCRAKGILFFSAISLSGVGTDLRWSPAWPLAVNAFVFVMMHGRIYHALQISRGAS